MRNRNGFAVSLFTLALCLVATGAASADPTLGPSLGTTKYASVVDGPDGEPDVDQYVVELVAGEAMTLTAAAARSSALLPELVLVRPDGTTIARPELPAVETAGGKKLALKGFLADQSGVWGIRVSGRNGTEGSYSLATKFKAPKKGVEKGGLVEGMLSSTYDFAGIEGATATVTLTWKPKSAAVDFTSFLAPDGKEVAGVTGPLFDESTPKPGSRTFKKVALPGPDGVHRLAFASDVPVIFTVSVAVKPPKRIASKKPINLQSAEPRLTPITAPVRSAPGRRIRINGSGFSTAALPAVFVGDSPATGIAVASDGNSIDIDVPAGPPGSSVGIGVQNPDGQAAQMDAFLFYVPLPTITDLTDVAGAEARVGTLAGGGALRLVGSGFADGYEVRFGGTLATGIDLVDPGTLGLRYPAHAAGDVDVTVTDDLGRSATSPFQFTYKAPPAFAASPYSPTTGAPAGGTPITVAGTGFAADDVLRFDGAVLAKTFDSTTAFRFTSPQKTPGLYTVTLTDRTGTAVSGPSFEVKAPPAFAASPYSPSAGGVAGGTVITVSGTGFAADDVLRFDGTVTATTPVSSTSFRFSSPAKSAGNYSLTLTDRFGAVVTGPVFTVKAPPTFDATPYSPAGGTTAGGTVVTLTGTNFENEDVLRIGGTIVAKVFDSSTQARFSSPAKAAGSHAVTLTDRAGAVVTGPDFIVKDPPAFAATPYNPAFGAVAGGTPITVTGSGFSAADVLKIDGTVTTKTFLSATSFRFTSPAKAAGLYTLTVTDSLGGVVSGPNFQVKAVPTITSVAAQAGPISGTNGVPFTGGTTLRVTGTGFSSGDTVKLGTESVTVTPVSATQFDFEVPASATPGGVALTVTDPVGQAGTLANAVRYVGYLDASEKRAPEVGSADDFSALRGQIGDLDVDGKADDVAIVSEYIYSGYRSEKTRLLLGDGSALGDATSTNIPSAYSDPNGRDDWNARAIALGDLDGDGDAEIAIAGYPVAYYDKYSYGYKAAHEVRVFSNDGSGGFSFDSGMSSGWTHPDVYGVFRGYTAYKIFSHTDPVNETPTTTDLAVGDLDGDGDDEIVTCSDGYRAGNLHIYPAYVNLASGQKYYAIYKGFNYSSYGYYTYRPSLRIHDNAGGSFREVSFPRLPPQASARSSDTAYPGRDLELGDVDQDGDLDMVVTWDDPTSTTFYGLFYTWYYGYSPTSAASSTWVLLNDGAGFFSDDSSKWIPGTSDPEFWHADRMALTDLDGDKDPDLVLLLEDSKNSFQGKSDYSTHALRILRNDGSGTGFTDVTSSALPSIPLSDTADDNLRGTALCVGDVDGDGIPDILVGTTESLFDSSGNSARRTRLLLGKSGLKFVDGSAFLPAPSDDTGEANDLKLGDIAGASDPSLLLFNPFFPETSAGSRFLRVFDWHR